MWLLNSVRIWERETLNWGRDNVSGKGSLACRGSGKNKLGVLKGQELSQCACNAQRGKHGDKGNSQFKYSLVDKQKQFGFISIWERECKRECVYLAADSLPTCPQHWRVCQCWSTRGWQTQITWQHHLLPPPACIKRKMVKKSWESISDMGYRHFNH